MSTSENVRIYAVFGYIRNFYRYIDLIARCLITDDIFDDILSHSSNCEMFTYTTFTNFSMKYLVVCMVYTDDGV